MPGRSRVASQQARVGFEAPMHMHKRIAQFRATASKATSRLKQSVMPLAQAPALGGALASRAPERAVIGVPRADTVSWPA